MSYQSTILSLTPPPDHWYQLGETAGTTILDKIGGANGTYGANRTLADSLITTREGASELPGTATGDGTIPNIDFSGSTEHTVNFWWKPTAATIGFFVAIGDDNTDNFAFRYRGDLAAGSREVQIWYDAGNANSASSAIINDISPSDPAVMLSLITTNAGWAAYVNGAFALSDAGEPGSYDDFTNPVVRLATLFGNNGQACCIDELMIWNSNESGLLQSIYEARLKADGRDRKRNTRRRGRRRLR